MFFITKKIIFIFIAFFIIGNVLLITPKYIGGNQFSVFQGQAWDCFSYLTSSVVYSKVSYNELKKVSKQDELKNQLIGTGKICLLDRPPVRLLYAFCGQLFKLKYHLLYYTYLIFFISQMILAIMFFLYNISIKIRPILIGFISLVFSLGFWGQYIIDINAWSQNSNMPVMAILVFCIIILLSNFESEKLTLILFIKILLLFTILFSSALYLYPENLFFQIFGIFIVCLAFSIYSFYKKKSFLIVLPIAAGLIISILLGFLDFEGILGFVFYQTNKSIGYSNLGWNNFNEFYLGKDGLNISVLSNIIDFLSGFFGMYFLTPSNNEDKLIAFILRFFLAGLIVLIIYYYFKYILFNFKKKLRFKIGRKILLVILLFLFPVFWMVQSIIYVSIFKKTDPVSIKVRMESRKLPENFEIIRVSSTGKEYLIKEIGGVLGFNDSYCTRIMLKTGKDEINDIYGIDITVGDYAYSFSKDEIINNWEKISNGNKLIFIVPDSINNNKKSKIKLFSNIINWKGDINILIETFPMDYIIYFIIFIFIILTDFKFIKFDFTAFEKNAKYFKILLLYCISFLLPISILALRNNFWAAGKAISYISPFMIVCLSFPFLSFVRNQISDFLKNPIFYFLLFQISFGFSRIYASTNPNGEHYDYPYPSSEVPIGLKYKNNWNIDNLGILTGKYNKFIINVENEWLGNYISVFLYENNKEFLCIDIPNESDEFNILNSAYKKNITGNSIFLVENSFDNNILKVNSLYSKEYFINSTIKAIESNLSARFGYGWSEYDKTLRWADGYFSRKKIELLFNEDKYFSNDSRKTSKQKSGIIIVANNENTKMSLKMRYHANLKDNFFALYLDGKKIGGSKPGEIMYEQNDIILKKGVNELFISSQMDVSENYTDWYPRETGFEFESILIEENK
jgi:hypothetical protein